jgi:hypothetical protein
MTRGLKVSSVLVICLLFLPVLTTNLANYEMRTNNRVSDFTPKTILFDESHCINGSSLMAPGNASLLSAMLKENGYNSSTNFDKPLETELLNQYDILVIFHPLVELTSSEQTDILSFVENGGGVLFVGANSDVWDIDGSKLNPISQQFGITFNSDEVRADITEFDENPLTTGVTAMSTLADGAVGESLTVIGSAQAVITTGDITIAASAEYGSGRAVCVGTPAPFIMYGYRSATYETSNYQFALNIIDWLAKNDQRTAVIPDVSIITVGKGPALNETEVDEYKMFSGLYHDHTTDSDGQSTPLQMLQRGVSIGLDFMVMTDHSYVRAAALGGITGGLTMRDIANQNGLNILIVPGAELSSGAHTTGFPLEHNIYTEVEQEKVDGIHAQGGIAILAHPTGIYNYGFVYGRFDEMGYDAFEVVNTGYMAGSGEDGYLHNFICASDGHMASFVGAETNIIYVKNPSGPNNSLTVDDIIDAILNRRLVVVDRVYNLIYGQEVWVNRYLEEISKANETVQNTRAYLDSLSETSDIGIAQQYIEQAEEYNYWWINSMRAIKYATMANSSVAQSIGINMEYDISMQADSGFDILLHSTNNNSNPISFNATLMKPPYLIIDEDSHIVEIGTDNTLTTVFSGQTAQKGFGDFWIVIDSFNTTEPLGQLIFGGRILLQNVSYMFTSVDGGIAVDVTLISNRQAVEELTSVVVTFNDGGTSDSMEMEPQYASFAARIGTYEQGTNITMSIEAVDNNGVHYYLDEMQFTVGSGGTTAGPSGGIDPMLLLVIGGAIGVIIVVGIIVKIKKS